MSSAGGKIQVAPFNFVCENNRRDDPEAVSFMVGKVASVKIKESVLKELLTKEKDGSYIRICLEDRHEV